jgi:predicted nucleic acid-binding protein
MRARAQYIDEFLSELAALVKPLELHFIWRPQARDPNDEMVLKAAMKGEADALVTYNVVDFISAANRFGLKVLRPPEVYFPDSD